MQNKQHITPTITYIGVDDLDIDLFESQYVVPNGIAYNSYLIEDDHLCIVDTVDGRKAQEWFALLSEALAGREPDYLVVHHMEPDHASLIAEVCRRYPAITLVMSPKAAKMLRQFFPEHDFGAHIREVGEGDTLSLGQHTLHFIAAPMVHWPEVLVSYDDYDKVLFSADGFGKFGALCHDEDWACEARRYYFNICGKYGLPVQNLLKKAATLDIRTICPLHGPVLSDNLGYYLGLYDTWSRYEAETEGVLIAYASIHGGTKAVAEHVAELCRAKGMGRVAITDLCRDDMAEAVEDAFRMPRLILAAASYDGDVFPAMHDFLHHLAIKNYQKRRVGIIENGSWMPTAAKAMRQQLDKMKDITIAAPVVTIWSRMKASDRPMLQTLVDAMV